jgi:hypothetical protein
MALNFPDAPNVDDEYAAEGRTWTWDGTVWLANETAVSILSAVAPLAYNGNTNALTVDLAAYDTTAQVDTKFLTKKTQITESIGVNTTCLAGYRYITTVTSGITLTLPASPSAGDEVQVLDSTGAATSIAVARNGNLINGLSEDADLDVAGFAVVLIYTGATFGWRLG